MKPTDRDELGSTIHNQLGELENAHHDVQVAQGRERQAKFVLLEMVLSDSNLAIECVTVNIGRLRRMIS